MGRDWEAGRNYFKLVKGGYVLAVGPTGLLVMVLVFKVIVGKRGERMRLRVKCEKLSEVSEF